MANRERKIYMFSKKNVDYIEKLKEKRDLKYNSDALDLIIREHRTNSDMSTEIMIKLIGEKLAEQLKAELLGFKKASNEIDKNTQIIIELLNGLFVKKGYKRLANTEEIKCAAIDDAKEFVEKRISKQRVSKLYREY